MKIRYITTIALLGSALVTNISAEKVKLEQLPPALQEKIRSQVGTARVEDIDRNVHNGKTTYEIAYKNAQGQNTELVLEDVATPAASDTTAPVDSRKIEYKELPVTVRRTADAQIDGGEVNDVERRVRDGRVIYGIGFKGANGSGPQRELVIDAQGNLLRGQRRSNTSDRSSTNVVARGIGSAPATSRTMNYTDLPQNVRTVAESHLRHGHVERVERRINNREISYTLLFKKEDGQFQQMVISEDGQILANKLAQSSALGSPGDGAVQSGVRGSGAPEQR